MNYRLITFIFIFFDFLFLSFYTNELSISYREAKIYFLSDDRLLYYLTHTFTSIFGQNDFGLRSPFIFLHTINLILIYNLSKYILNSDRDRFLSLLIYAMLPGVNSSALILSEANIIIFLTLLFAYSFLKSRYLSYLVLTLLLFIDNSFAILFLALFFYSIYKRDKLLSLYSFTLFSISMYIFGFDSGGKPKGYFLDTLGLYSAIFSPFVFLYFFYSIYRILIKEEKILLWFISFSALAFSLILSFRQKMNIEDFAPFIVIATPLMVKVFLSSYKVRVREFRKNYHYLFIFLTFTLSLNFVLMFYNRPLYYFFDKERHFAYKFHVAKELASELKRVKVNQIDFEDKKLALRLKFYDISEGKSYKLTKRKVDDSSIKVSIFHTNQKFDNFYVTKIHK